MPEFLFHQSEKSESAEIQKTLMDRPASGKATVQRFVMGLKAKTMHHDSMDELAKSERDVPKTIVKWSVLDPAKTLPSPPDYLVLYRSPVRGGAHPDGYDREFLSLKPVVRAASRLAGQV